MWIKNNSSSSRLWQSSNRRLWRTPLKLILSETSTIYRCSNKRWFTLQDNRLEQRSRESDICILCFDVSSGVQLFNVSVERMIYWGKLYSFVLIINSRGTFHSRRITIWCDVNVCVSPYSNEDNHENENPVTVNQARYRENIIIPFLRRFCHSYLI